MNHHHDQPVNTGFNLIESAIVLAIVGLVIGGIWVAYEQVNYHYQKQKFFDGFLSIQKNAERHLAQNLACGNGYYLSNQGVYSPDFYALIYPQEWREIDMDRFSTGWLGFEIMCDTNSMRFLQVNPHFHTYNFCKETQNYLQARGVERESSCSPSQLHFRVWFDIPRRS